METKGLWQQLPDGVRTMFSGNARKVVGARGEAIYRQGDKPKGLYFVESGLVALVAVSDQAAREHLLRVFRAPQFFGHRSLLSDQGYHATAIFLEPSVLRMIPVAVIQHALESHPVLYREIARALALELGRSERHRLVLLEQEVLARTAEAIVYLKEIHPEYRWTRQEIANYCGSTVFSVIKALGELEKRGLITQSKREIDIVNRTGLLDLMDS
jgi:CRP-like cAMP-binding protein